MKNNTEHILAILALLSGACALAYEVLYMRLLTTMLGDIYYVSAALLAAFIFGIGLGAKLSWRYSQHLPWLEIGTGAYALVLPFLLSGFSSGSMLASVTASPYFTVLTTTALVIVPAILIGFSIPLFSSWLSNVGSKESTFGRVFYLYHAGTFISVIAVEFILIRTFGVQFTVMLSGVLNIGVGLLLLIYRKKVPGIHFSDDDNGNNFLLSDKVALALSGLASAWFQMFFIKLCFNTFLPNRENFAISICMSLAGLALGALWVKKYKIRFSQLMLLMSATVAFTYIFYRDIALLYNSVVWTPEDPDALLIVHKLFFAALYSLIPMTCFGALIPAMMSQVKYTARESGNLIWISCVFSVAAYLAFAFFVYELIPLEHLLLLIIALGLLSAFIANRLTFNRVNLGITVASCMASAILIIRWDAERFYEPDRLKDFEKAEEFKLFKSGPDDVALIKTSDGYTMLSYNGHRSIQIRHNDVINPSELMYGVVPALTAPRLEKALVVGFGSGITAGTCSQFFKQTDVVEINQAFYQCMDEISDVNLSVSQNPAANLMLGDGRAFLTGKLGLYDAIVNTPPGPIFFSATKLYTVDYFKKVSKALKADGVFCIWIANGSMTSKGVEIILAALYEVFEYADLRLLRNGYYALSCSNSPLKVRGYRQLPFSAAFSRVIQPAIKPLRPEEIFKDLRISENIFKHFEPKTEIMNTDDMPILEFYISRLKEKKDVGRSLFFMNQKAMGIENIQDEAGFSKERFERKKLAFEQFGQAYYKRYFEPQVNTN